MHKTLQRANVEATAAAQQQTALKQHVIQYSTQTHNRPVCSNLTLPYCSSDKHIGVLVQIV